MGSARARLQGQGEGQGQRQRQGQGQRQGQEGSLESAYLSKVSKILENSGDRCDGAEICADIFKLAANSREAYLGLCSLGSHGVSEVGRYSLELEKIPFSSTSGDSPVSESQRDLLPIPVSLAKCFSRN